MNSDGQTTCGGNIQNTLFHALLFKTTNRSETLKLKRYKNAAIKKYIYMAVDDCDMRPCTQSFQMVFLYSYINIGIMKVLY